MGLGPLGVALGGPLLIAEVARRSRAPRPRPAPPPRAVAQPRLATARPPAASRTVQTRTAATVRAEAEQALAQLNRNPLVRDIAGDVSGTVALVPGAARGLWHTVEDVGHAAYLAHGFSPYTYFLPTAKDARRQARSDVTAIGQKVSEVWDDPRGAVEDAKQGFMNWREGIDPTATPKADTATGEWARRFPMGLNQGEFVFDVGTSVFGGAAVKTLRAPRLARGLSNGRRAARRPNTPRPGAPTAADYRARGVPEGMAEYFAEPYPMTGMGSHLWGRNRKLPKALGGGTLPRAIVESPFNVLKPRDWTRGEMYERHVNVDGGYYGGKVPARHGGGGWNGDDLGWERYGPLRSFWYGAPGPLKAAIITPVTAGAGAAVDYFYGQEDER